MKAKYKRGKPIKTVADFEKSKAIWFRVRFGENVKAVLEAMQKNGETFQQGMKEINDMKADLSKARNEVKALGRIFVIWANTVLEKVNEWE